MGGEGDHAQALPPTPGTLVPLHLGALDCHLTGVSRGHSLCPLIQEQPEVSCWARAAPWPRKPEQKQSRRASHMQTQHPSAAWKEAMMSLELTSS